MTATDSFQRRQSSPINSEKYQIDNEHVTKILHYMYLSREGDLKAARMVRQGKAWFHISSLGHEALAAVGLHLRQSDLVFMHYRDVALVLAKGTSHELICRYFLGNVNHSSPGKNMSAHLSDKKNSIFSVASPTGSQCLPAVGAAWGIQLSDREDVVICGIGDSAVRQGEFYEAVCFAIAKQLPVLFLVSDNLYGISTSTKKENPFRFGLFQPHLYEHVNGRDAFDIYHVAERMISQVREKRCPAILWIEMDRLDSHSSSDDQRVYRSQEELANMVDPIEKFATQCLDKNLLSKTEIQNIQNHVKSIIDETYESVAVEHNTPFLQEHLYGESVVHQSLPPIRLKEAPTMVEAINQVLLEGLKTYSNLLMLGEDIEDPKGGVFGFTKGLSSIFKDRVCNAPLAEATIIGAAVGLASTGWKPVFELQFIDFIGPALNQIINQVSSLRWRTNGEWSCPMIVYAPYGAYLPGGGIWHSECYEALLAYLPGLRVAVPSTPSDVAGLFWSAFQDPDPSFILIPKHLMRKRMAISKLATVPWGKARVRQEGKDVTIVGWGNSIEIITEAAEQLKGTVSIEIIDLRTLVPCDMETISLSLKKTGRLIVVHEDKPICGFGGSIIQRVTSYKDSFDYLLSPPQLVARKHVHIPFQPKMEYQVLPDANKVLQAIQLVME
ncbi:MAG: thiamine pyrophosphate-dependent enzyme [Waddliaceae bacterium]